MLCPNAPPDMLASAVSFTPKIDTPGTLTDNTWVLICMYVRVRVCVRATVQTISCVTSVRVSNSESCDYVYVAAANAT